MARSPARRPRRVTSPLPSAPIRVRMYNVGFGDCFLVMFPATAENPARKVLFDCGTIKRNPAHKTQEIVAELIKDIAAESADGVPHLDVVVATHRHADHISGFDSPLWQSVVVTEVWLPWTEADEDVQAIKLRADQERLALALTAAFAASPGSEELLSIAEDAVTNAKAIETLKHGFAGTPQRRYLEAKTSGSRVIDAPSLPGISVHLLGPSRDEEALKAMDPHADESFLALWATQAGTAPGERPAPFPDTWKCTDGQRPLDPSTEQAIRTANDALGSELAFRLDSVLNNTSLMLVFVVGGAVLLFPGDAQWGSWKAALNDAESRRLLDRVTFLKVGHHGSHNATPKSFIHQCLAPRKLTAKIASMISVVPRGKWEIPRQPLVDALIDVTMSRTVRSDTAGPAMAPFSRNKDMWIEAEVAC